MIQPATAPRLTVPVNEHDHVLGPITAPVTMVEYGDYECPHCGQAHHMVKQLRQLMGHRMCFVFRHFPLTTVHPHAQQAAEAAEAAGVQGKFWEMHYVLFEHQQALEPGDLLQYASALGLNVPRLRSELATHMHAPRVREHFMSGVRSGVNGTPTFFINGLRHDGTFDLDALVDALEVATGPMTGHRQSGF
jgi:protein-disulfide isomerase